MHAEVPTAWGNERRGWHIDKTISVSDLISIALIVIPALIWASTVETRFTGLETVSANFDRQLVAEKLLRDQQRTEDRQQAASTMSDLQQQIRSMDNRVTDRLEKIADKVGARK